ncbi:MAG: alpha/beta hydrolase [Pseudomonadota bacterium]
MSNSARFGSEIVSIGNVDLFRWRGGEGAPVLLLHGHTQTSDIWAQLADALVNMGRTVIAPDLHGLGRSSVPGSGYDKSSMARDFKTLIDKEGFADTPVTIVGHDLGVFAAYAYAAQFRDHVDRLILMDATVPGIGIWPVLLQQPRTWHFGFYGPHAERLVEGRERIYLDRFWDEFSATPDAIGEDLRAQYTAHYQRPNGLKGAFSHFEAFGKDAEDDTQSAVDKLSIPVLGIAGSESLGPLMEAHVNELSEQGKAVTIEDAGHWLLEEKPEATIDAVCRFLTPE